MLKTVLLVISAALVPQALAVCSTGDIALGEVAGFNASNPFNSATIWDSSCNQLDQKFGDFDICGSYPDGSTVICNAGGEVPASVQLGNGLDFGNCFADSIETCGSRGRTLYCCTPAPPPA